MIWDRINKIKEIHQKLKKNTFISTQMIGYYQDQEKMAAISLETRVEDAIQIKRTLVCNFLRIG